MRQLASYVFSCFLLPLPILLAFNEEQILQEMTLEQKIGQFIIVPAQAERLEDGHFSALSDLLHEGLIGGVLLKSGKIEQQQQLISFLQSATRFPLLIAADAENGLGMRMENAIAYPKNLTLGAITENTWIKKMGQEIGRQCRELGIHINFAPVVDVNTNPNNPIVHMRSFGDNVENVLHKASAYIEGMQEYGVTACIKHFPGHGDTDVDSHIGLPRISHDLGRLVSTELQPFQKLISKDLRAVMTAHIQIPAFDQYYPATLSRNLIQNYWKERQGYSGLMITDALNMKALTKSRTPEEIALRALFAGNDLLLYGDHVIEQVDEILRKTVRKVIAHVADQCRLGFLPEKMIDRQLAKILRFKKMYCKEEPMSQTSLVDRINTKEAQALKKQLYREALTLIEDPLGVAQTIYGGKIALIERGGNSRLMLADKNIDRFFLESNASNDSFCTLQTELEKYDRVVIADFGFDRNHYRSSHDWTAFLRSIDKKVFHVIFGSPYALCQIPQGRATLLAYEADEDMQEAVELFLQGAITAEGRLPIHLERE